MIITTPTGNVGTQLEGGGVRLAVAQPVMCCRASVVLDAPAALALAQALCAAVAPDRLQLPAAVATPETPR